MSICDGHGSESPESVSSDDDLFAADRISITKTVVDGDDLVWAIGQRQRYTSVIRGGDNEPILCQLHRKPVVLGGKPSVTVGVYEERIATVSIGEL